jgi:catechol 2,3-dioxygenase-like lactoylglutathione lyase family enzyme
MQISPKPVLLAAVPQLFVSDIAASCAFFTGKLGFAVHFRYGQPPFYAQVTRDGASLALRARRSTRARWHCRGHEGRYRHAGGERVGR